MLDLPVAPRSAVAFLRSGDANIGEFDDAVILKTLGEVPDDLQLAGSPEHGSSRFHIFVLADSITPMRLPSSLCERPLSIR